MKYKGYSDFSDFQLSKMGFSILHNTRQNEIYHLSRQ